MHKPHVTVAAVVKKGERFLLVKERDKFTSKICYNPVSYTHLRAHEP